MRSPDLLFLSCTELELLSATLVAADRSTPCSSRGLSVVVANGVVKAL
jgi:hypothetical protein